MSRYRALIEFEADDARQAHLIAGMCRTGMALVLETAPHAVEMKLEQERGYWAKADAPPEEPAEPASTDTQLEETTPEGEPTPALDAGTLLHGI